MTRPPAPLRGRTSRLDLALLRPAYEPIQAYIKPVRNLQKAVNVELSKARDFYRDDLLRSDAHGWVHRLYLTGYMLVYCFRDAAQVLLHAAQWAVCPKCSPSPYSRAWFSSSLPITRVVVDRGVGP